MRLTPQPKATLLSRVISGFLLERQTRGLTRGTLFSYQDELDRFAEWLGHDQNVMEIDPETVRRYLVHLGETRNKGGVHASFRVVRALFYWYEQEFEPENWKNPMRKVVCRKPHAHPLPGVTLETVQKLLKSCNNERADRDRALLLTLVDTGLRSFELRALDIRDVNMVTGAVYVRNGKGDKSRVAFLGTRTLDALTAYLKTRSNPGLDTPLFTTDEGERFRYNGLVSLVRRRAVDAGVDRPRLHDFRRCFAVSMLRNGADLVTLSRLMGHADLEILKVYLSQNEKDLAEVHRKSGPMDHLLAVS